jgi:hypothetical protein
MNTPQGGKDLFDYITIIKIEVSLSVRRKYASKLA